MRRNIVAVLVIVLIILQIMSLIRINNLQNELRGARDYLSHLLSNQSIEINKIYENVDSTLKREASIIDSYEYSFGVPDKDKLTIPVTFNILPKETKGDTSVTLYVSGASATMSRNNTSFTATLPVYIFDTFEAKVVLADSGIEKTESLDVRENLRERFLPKIYADFEDESGVAFSKKGGELSGECRRKGKLRMDVKLAQNNKIEKARFVLEVDGNIVSEGPLKTDFWTDIDEKLTLSAGQTLTLSVVATDSFGLIHKVLLDKLVLDENADILHETDDRIWIGEVIITDSDGKVLYAPQYELQ